jgi:hypothetical protein
LKSNGQPFVVEHVAEARETTGHLTLGLPLQSVHPVVSRALREATRQQVGDGTEICRRDLAASDHDPASRA